MQFFRASSGKFKPERMITRHFLERENFVKDLVNSQIDFDDGRRLVVLVGEVDKELTSHSAS